jgi:hypothetical protein
MRSLLREDTYRGAAASPLGAPVGLDDDPGVSRCCPPGPGEWTGPVLSLSMRERTGFTDDGDPTYTWAQVHTGNAIVRSTRAETDDTTGRATVTAQVTMLDPGTEELPALDETATAADQDGQRWQVTRLDRAGGRLELTLTRSTDAA